MGGYSRKYDYAKARESDAFTRPAPSSPVSGVPDGSVVTVTSTTYTVAGQDTILVDDDSAAAEVTITLPPVSGAAVKPREIKKIGSTANVVIDGNGSETIDDGLTVTLTSKYESVTLMPTASGWFIV